MDANELYAQAKKNYEAGNRAESVALFEQARAAYTAAGDEAQAAAVANDLGVVYYLVGRMDQARHALQDSLSAQEKLGNVLGQAKAIGNLAQLMNRAGEKDAAEKNYLRSAELFHQVGERMMEFDTYRALSQMQLQRGRWIEALSTYDLALAAKGGASFLRWFLQIPLKLLKIR